MSNILILAPLAISAVATTRGSGAANLMTPDPKEVWVDSASGGAVQVDIDLGSVQSIDTVFLGHLLNAASAATWQITGGVAGYTQTVLLAASPLRAVDSTTGPSQLSHAFWTGVAAMLRYLRITLTLPAGSAPLSAGVLCIGKAFVPTFNKEWGAGRGVLDSSSVTALPSGGYAIVEGARKGSYTFTLGDLAQAEVDQLYEIQMACGESRPVLVVEDPARSVGQVHRMHYGIFRSLRKYERRSVNRTRWELNIDQWI